MVEHDERYEGVDPIIKKEERLLGVICYLPFGGIVPHLMKKGGSDFLAFHARQGFAIFIPVVILIIPGNLFLWFIFFVAYIALAVFLGGKAYAGEAYTFDFAKPYLAPDTKNQTKK